ncbi:MAG: hypothetical protein ACREFP_07210 [Acetobacteraceae bacterium]
MEHDVSIPDQKRQGEAYCAALGCQLVESHIEAAASATSDRRPEFQCVVEAGIGKPAACPEAALQKYGPRRSDFSGYGVAMTLF